MKILHIIQRPQLRGAELFTCQLSDYLISNNHEVVIAALFGGTSDLPFKGRLVKMNLKSSNRFFDLYGWKALAKLIDEEKPDIVQANAADTLKYAVLTKLLHGFKAPVIFRNASLISLYIKGNAIKKFFNRVLFAFTSHIISVSESSKTDLVKMFPGLAKKISVVPIGIVTSGHVSFPKNKSEPPVLVHVGGFTFEKNHKGLINIFHTILKSNPSVQLWLVGDGPLRLSIEQLVSEKKLSHAVRFMGWQQEVSDFIVGARALLLPSIIEGIPGVVLEAQYYGTPVVAYDVGGVSEIVNTGETGWLVKKNNEQAFADAVLDVLKNTEQVETVVARAKNQVVNRFSMHSITGEFIKIYEDILERGQS